MPDSVKPLVVVWWKDHFSSESSEWQDWADAEASLTCPMPIAMSTGFLYGEDKESIALISTICEGEHGGVLRLLKKVIVKQIRLEPPHEDV